MDQTYFNTIEETRKPNRHLSLEERGMIQALKQQGYSLRKIAAVIGCAHTTIMYELWCPFPSDTGTCTAIKTSRASAKRTSNV